MRLRIPRAGNTMRRASSGFSLNRPGAPLLWFLIGGCVLATASASAEDSGRLRIDVPIVKQLPHLCAVSCISMVMRYWSCHIRDNNREAIVAAERCAEARYSDDAQGVFGRDVAQCFKTNGYKAFT